MRALCGSIMAAGAMIGLGLATLGIGNRYAYFSRNPGTDAVFWLRWRDLDEPMMLIVVVLLAGLIIGLVTAFIGLMYHHHRRHMELHGHHHGVRGEDRPRVTV